MIKNTSYKDYIETIYLKGLFKREKKMETTFHITTLNVLFCTDFDLFYYCRSRYLSCIPVCYHCLEK